MRLIMLDVDGVLNSNSTRTTTRDGWCFVEDIFIERLGRLVHETGAKVVLSSTWREGWNQQDESKNEPYFNDLRAKLSEYGIELYDRLGPMHRSYERGLEIQEWFESHPDIEVENFIILDDYNDMIPYMDHLLQTRASIGLTDDDVEVAINYLSAAPNTYDLQDMDDFAYWIDMTAIGNWRCGICGHEFIFTSPQERNYRYCPWCGRTMISHYDYVNLIYPLERV